MARSKAKSAESSIKPAKTTKPAPADTERGRANVLIGLSMNLAEKKLRDGTASNQLILHFLNLATEESQLKRERLQADTDLAKAKKNAYDAAAASDETYQRAVDAMLRYNRKSDDEDVY